MEKNRIGNFIKTVLLLALLFSSGPAFSQITYLQRFSTKNGLPSNNCFYTLQDSKGYLWIATDAGVSRFDGKVFENFSVDDGLPDNQILQLKEDREGRIWFLALNGQLSYFSKGKIYNERNNSQLSHLNFNALIVSFFQDSKGRIWLGTNKNLLVMWNGKSIRKYISANSDRQFINTFVYEDPSGKIWTYSNTSVRILEGNTFKVVPHSSLPLSYKSASNMPDKSLAYIDKDGLNVKTGDGAPLKLKINPALLQNNLGYFYFDPNEGLWISNNSGIYHIDDKGKVNKYLQGVASSQIIKDAKNNIWFTTADGLYMLPQKDERLYIVNRLNGLSSDIVKSITKDDLGRLWLGFDFSALNTLDTRTFAINEIPIPDTKKYNLIKQVNFDTVEKAIYFASDYGLGRIKNRSGKQHIEYLKNVDNSMFVIKSFSISSDKRLALALSSGVVVLSDRTRKFEFSSSNFNKGSGFFRNRSYSVFYDTKGSLWFSNLDGLSEFDNDNLYSYYEKSPLLTRRINDIQELNDGTIILATDGYGIIYIKDRKVIKVITQRDGLMDNICKKLFVKDNEAWVISNTGINKIVLKGKETHIETFEYTGPLLTEGINGMYIDDQNAYFATNNGLIYFSILKTQMDNLAPSVFITAIVNNKVKLDLDQRTHVLDPYNNNITFHYSAIDFQNKNVTYRYRLKGDATWTETKNRRLEFSSLEPGDYTFELSAKSNNSPWSNPAKVKFMMARHFWQTLWFFLLILVISGFALYKLAVMVTRRQKNKEQEQLLLKNKILMLEQRALQAMMNPHFVFNVMNSIQHYINTKDTTSANKVLTGFARLIRKNLEICTKSYVTLEEELEYLELYLSLEKKRFGEKFSYKIAVDKNIDKEETTIPSMILQPYIENAIWHGIMPKEDGGNIDIDINLKGTSHLLIRITDNGIGIDNSLKEKKAHHTSKGMDLTKERINLLNQVEPNPIQMEIKQNGESGTFVAITIPLK